MNSRKDMKDIGRKEIVIYIEDGKEERYEEQRKE